MSKTLDSLVQRLVTLCEHNLGRTLKLQDVVLLAILLCGGFLHCSNVLLLYPFYTVTSVTFANNVNFYLVFLCLHFLTVDLLKICIYLFMIA